MRRFGGLAVALWCGCSGGEDVQRPDTFTVEHEEDVQVNGGPDITVVGADALDTPQTGAGLTQSLTTTLENQGVTEADVESVKLTSMHLEVTAPLRNGQPMQDLRFLDSLSMFISASGMGEVKVAQTAAVPDGGTQSASFGQGVYAVDVPVLDEELKAYIAADAMTARTEVTANGKPAFACTIKVKTVMTVKVSPRGAVDRGLGI